LKRIQQDEFDYSEKNVSMNDSPKKIPEKNEEEEKKDDLKNRLIKSKDMRKNIKRELTGHVVTRWYRAPQKKLLEKD